MGTRERGIPGTLEHGNPGSSEPGNVGTRECETPGTLELGNVITRKPGIVRTWGIWKAETFKTYVNQGRLLILQLEVKQLRGVEGVFTPNDYFSVATEPPQKQ